jgi:endonuclease/exonuclease/phosphatase (EEP) superfamily protein YafD
VIEESSASRPARAASFRRVLALGALATWFALIAGMLGEYAWLLDLLAHFRVHCLAAFIVLACLALMLRDKLFLAVAAVGAALSAAPLVRYVEPVAASRASHEASLRLVSFNINYRNDDLARAATFLEESGADVVVLQEVTRAQARELDGLLPSYPHRSVDIDWRGAAIYSRWPMTSADWAELEQRASRGAMVQLDWRGSRIAVLGLHLHWPMSPGEARIRNRQLRRVAALAQATTGPLIVAGDFNVTPWSPHFQRALASSGLRDCALGQGLGPSWPAPATWLGIRIDHCLASPHWRVLDARVGPNVGSDHRPIIVELALETATSRER